MNGICVRIKELRKQLEMSQVEFAKNLGVTNAHISKIEKGGTVPSDSLIKLIAKEYSINEEWIKSGVEPIFIHEILDQAEDDLINSSSLFNKLLSSDSHIIRGVAAELKFCFTNITDVTGLNENQKIEYLMHVKNMFSVINQYNSAVKETIRTNQMIMDDVSNSQFQNYKMDMGNCIDQYENLIKKYT